MSSMRAMLMEDFYKNSEQRLSEQRSQIEELQNKLQQYKEYDDASLSLIPEMKVLFPNVTKVAVSKVVETNVSTMKSDTTEVALLSFDKRPQTKEINTIEEWLKARLQTQKLRLIID